MQALLINFFLLGVLSCQVAFGNNAKDHEDNSQHNVAKRSGHTLAYSYRYQYGNRAHQCVKPGAPRNGLTWYSSRTIGSIVIHSCKVGFALDGPRIRTCQPNGKWSKALPKCVGVDCDDPGTPDNSIRVLSSTTLNSIVKYRCKAGYRLMGSSYRVCQANSKWTGVAPECVGTSCSRLANPSNGAVSFPSRQIGSTATYSCNSGFSLVGARTRVCHTGGVWSGTAPTCRAVDCGDLSNPQNGRVTFTSTTFGSNAVYSCNSGFTLVGSNQRQCQIDGTWSRHAPICRVLSCGRLGSPTNGKVVLSGTTPGSVATYSCNDGFQLRGNVRRSCQNNGQWDGSTPVCRAAVCEPLVAPLNGFITFSSTSVQRPGDKATYSCREGFTLSGGDRVRVCQQDVTYTGTAPRCIGIICGALRDPANGRVTISGTSVGSHATYTCNRGFELVGNSRRTCLSSGGYDGSEPSCKPVNCGRVRAPLNGRIVITTTLFGGAAKYFCNDGFALNGVNIRRCGADAQWTSDPPTCRSLGCGQLSSPENGRVQLTGTTIGSLASYFCNNGFVLVGDRRRVCQRSSQWSGNMPSCRPVFCEVLEPPQFGTVTVTGSTPGATATYDCNQGAELIGQRTRTCQKDGKYSGQAPTCRLIFCEQLSSPVSGQVSVSGDSRPGSVATYSCNQGFSLEGVSVRTCGSDGSYSGQAPTCREISCGHLNNPENGRVQFSSTLVSSVATYSCNNGYNLVGVAQRICQPSGQWSGAEPRCKIVDCGVLPEPVFGTVDFSSTTFLSKATYSCNEGFQLSQFVTRVCQANGRWSESAPTCLSIACEHLTSPENGFVVVRGNSFGALATYSCHPGFELIGQRTRECQRDGTYSGQAPRCQAVSCGKLLDPVNGIVEFRSTSLGATASYSCDRGFNLRGGSIIRVCQPSGVWSGQEPTCVGVTCSQLDSPINGRVRFSSITVGSTASYDCNPGFQLQGVDSRICSEEGEWTGDAPICISVSCGPLVSPQHGSVVISGSNTNAIARYSCDNGFSIIGKSTRVCTSSGVWSGEAPTCQAIQCPQLTDPQFGSVSVTGNTVGFSATYSCNANFVLSDSTPRQCQSDGTWSGTEPICRAIDCGPLPPLQNGVIRVSGTSFGESARYTCDFGFVLQGDALRVCQLDGTWSGSDPQCIESLCPDLPDPANGRVRVSGRRIGSIASYECNEGFEATGLPTRVCRNDQEWTGSAPACQAVDCQRLFDPVNGRVQFTSTTVGSDATYVCNPGYDLVGTSRRTCQPNRLWSGQEPSCTRDRTECPLLNPPQDGDVALSGNTPGSSATYTCVTGFTIIGNDIRFCQNDGTWTGEDPICRSVNCPDLADPLFGSLRYINGRGFGAIVRYNCEPGYLLVGDSSRTCKSDGLWSGSGPVCVGDKKPPPVTSCGDPGTPANGRKIGTSYEIDSIVHYECNVGYSLTSGDASLTCGIDGQWLGTLPTCTKNEEECYGGGRVFDSCGRACRCENGKFVDCCRFRRDFASYTDEEKEAYTDAVLAISTDPAFSSRYYALLEDYKASFDTDIYSSKYDTSQFFVWNRYFLLEYENLLQEIDCRITLPFYDWTVRPLQPYTSPVWKDDYGFGGSSRESDHCVSSGPFQSGEYSLIPSAGSGCLKREYKDKKFPTRSLIERDLLTQPASNFDMFHLRLQLYVHTNVRCFVGGTMCTKDAANDPVFILHLTMMDYIFDRWQSSSEDRLRTRYATDSSPLILAPNHAVNDYHNNKNLPGNTAVCYNEPTVKSHIPIGGGIRAQSAAASQAHSAAASQAHSAVASQAHSAAASQAHSVSASHSNRAELTMGCLSHENLTSTDLGLKEDEVKFIESRCKF